DPIGKRRTADRTFPRVRRVSPTYKPGSVERITSLRRSFLSERGHPRPLAAYPQRLDRGGHLSLLIWPCSRWGLPCRVCCQPRGGLLLHLFTLARHFLRSASAVSFLWHYPSPAALAADAQAVPG